MLCVNKHGILKDLPIFTKRKLKLALAFLRSEPVDIDDFSSFVQLSFDDWHKFRPWHLYLRNSYTSSNIPVTRFRPRLAFDHFIKVVSNQNEDCNLATALMQGGYGGLHGINRMRTVDIERLSYVDHNGHTHDLDSVQKEFLYATKDFFTTDDVNIFNYSRFIRITNSDWLEFTRVRTKSTATASNTTTFETMAASPLKHFIEVVLELDLDCDLGLTLSENGIKDISDLENITEPDVRRLTYTDSATGAERPLSSGRQRTCLLYTSPSPRDS